MAGSSLGFVSWCVRVTLRLNRQWNRFLQVIRQRGSFDIPYPVLYDAPHNPVYDKIEKHGGYTDPSKIPSKNPQNAHREIAGTRSMVSVHRYPDDDALIPVFRYFLFVF